MCCPILNMIKHLTIPLLFSSGAICPAVMRWRQSAYRARAHARTGRRHWGCITLTRGPSQTTWIQNLECFIQINEQELRRSIFFDKTFMFSSVFSEGSDSRAIQIHFAPISLSVISGKWLLHSLNSLLAQLHMITIYFTVFQIESH